MSQALETEMNKTEPTPKDLRLWPYVLPVESHVARQSGAGIETSYMYGGVRYVWARVSVHTLKHTDIYILT